MPSRRALAVLVVLLATLVAGAAVHPPSARATTRDELMKTGLLALQGAIEKNGAARMFVYPHRDSVSPAGGLVIPFWPRDPWTGRRLTPGTTRGHYTYVRSQEGRSYVLTAYLSGGRAFVVKGRMAHTPMLAYDHRGKEGLSLIYLYVKLWSLSHAGALPTAAQVSREGAVGQRRGSLIWPSNPWDHGPMEQRPDRGSFAYARAADGASFTLTLHKALDEDWVLRGAPLQPTAGDTP